MNSKLFKTIIIITLVLTVLVGAAACSLRVDESRNTVKPDIKMAMDNYAKLTTKKSEFSGKIILKLFGQKNPTEKEPVSHTIGQEAKLDRIQNNGSTYIEGTLRSCHVTSAVDGLLQLIPDKLFSSLGGSSVNNKSSVKSYLTGKTYYSLDMGHRNGNYNIKTTYHNGEANPQPYWAATNDESINAFLTNNSINHKVKISEYLMFSTFIDLSSTSAMAAFDNASKFLSTDTNSFVYNIGANSEKIYQMVFDTIAKYMDFLSDDEYEVFLDMYQTMLPKMKNWVKVGNASVDASVSKNNLPVRMNTKVTVYLDIPLQDLLDMVDILVENEKENKEIKLLLNGANVFLRGREGETGKFSADFDIILDENFVYDDNSCSLDDVETDMFLDIAVDNAAREVFKIAVKSSDTADSNLEINNDVKISDGDNSSSEVPPTTGNGTDE